MFNPENFTPDRKIYTGTACGACDKYEVCTWGASGRGVQYSMATPVHVTSKKHLLNSFTSRPPACPRAVPSPWLKKENSSYRVWSQGLLFVSLAMFLKLFKHVSTSGTLCWPGTVVAGFQILPVVVPACNILFGGLRVRFFVPAHKICCACA